MASDRTTVLDRSALAAILRGATDGVVEMLGALTGSPILVVDLDSPGDRPLPAPPPALPAVIVGTSRRPRSGRPAVAVDVALTGAVSPPHPWVSVPDLGSAVSDITAAVERSPLASVTLAQVLRAGRPDSLGHDLILESLAYSTLQGGPEFGRWRAGRPPRRRSPDGVPALVVVREGGRLTITLDRPEVRNAFNAAMRDQLCEALSVAGADPSITEVQLLGHGPDFCSGGDLTEFGTFTDPVSAHLGRTARSAASLLGVVGDRVTAQLHGACIGAGIELPALAHRVLARADTRVQLPEVAMGLIPGAGGTATLPRRIGRHRTAWLALSGEPIDAPVALAWGLVDEIVDR
jgi:Enoyl-CoA hydratase/isomerase